jgi:chromosomal replication initiation ATPase DnaA
VALGHGIEPTLLLSRLRYKTIALARHHFIAVLRWSTMMSYPEIGALLDLDHTTVMAAERHYERVLNGEGR